MKRGEERERERERGEGGGEGAMENEGRGDGGEGGGSEGVKGEEEVGKEVEGEKVEGKMEEEGKEVKKEVDQDEEGAAQAPATTAAAAAGGGGVEVAAQKVDEETIEKKTSEIDETSGKSEDAVEKKEEAGDVADPDGVEGGGGAPAKTGDAAPSAAPVPLAPVAAPAPNATETAITSKPVDEAEKEEGDDEDDDDQTKDEIVIPLGYIRNEDGTASCLPGAFSLFLTDTTLDRVGIADLNDESEVLFRYVDKHVVLEDIQFRGKISDFQVIKANIERGDAERIMVKVNTENAFGDDNNFEIGTTQAVCDEWEKIFTLRKLKKEREEEEARAAAAGGGTAPKRRRRRRKKKAKTAPASKTWESLGSEIEILEARTVQTRERISVSFARSRKEFNQSLEFTDKDAQELWNGSQMECRPYKDVKFDLQRVQFDAGCQSMGNKEHKEVQATRQPLLNKSTQYCARSIGTAANLMSVMESPGFSNFLNGIGALCDDALQQNEVMDIFEDDFAALADEDSAPGNRSEAAISEYQSFTHLTYSKNKLVSSIDWLPNRRGIVAVATTEPLSFDERIERAGRVTTSAILIWNFKDPIHPQCVLESPSDIMCFRFNEQHPELVAGGMYNGQVVLWDTSPAAGRTGAGRRRGDDAGGDEDAAIPVIKAKFLSAIESSHTYPVSDLTWMKAGASVDDRGRIVYATSANDNPLGMSGSGGDAEVQDKGDDDMTQASGGDGSDQTQLSTQGKAHQSSPSLMFMTTSADGRVLFWDTAPRRDAKKSDVVWVPRYSIRLSRLDKGGYLGCSKMSILAGSTRFFCGSHDGEVAYVDHELANSTGSGSGGAGGGAIGTGPGSGMASSVGASGLSSGSAGASVADMSQGDFTRSVTDGHFGPVNALDRSPFFSDIVLSVGDWTFKVWKEEVGTPIYSSPCSAAYLTTGCWSPTRPGVIYTARTDGVLEVWDLLDRSHEPSMTVSASSASITALEFLKEKESSMTQRMAVGDRQGVLHIMDLPRNLRKAAVGERATMNAFFERELKRVESMAVVEGPAASSYKSAPVMASSGGGGVSGNVTGASGGEDETVSANGSSRAANAISVDVLDMAQQEEEYLKLEREFMASLGIPNGNGNGSAGGHAIGTNGEGTAVEV